MRRSQRRQNRLAALACLALLLAPGAAWAADAIEPGAADGVAAALLPDGRVQLENAILRFIFDPRDAGAAASIRHRLTGKELAVCATYGDQHFKAFREALHRQRMKEGRIAPRGQPYRLVRLQVIDGAAIAAFDGGPGGISLLKTYRLRPRSSRLEVELRLTNKGDAPTPAALWLLSGLRVGGENVDCFAPTPRGTESQPDAWVKGSSSFLIVPRAAESWTAAVAHDQERSGVIIAGQRGQVESIHNWLAKFSGFTLGYGTPRTSLAPGDTARYNYSFVATTNLPRIDAAAPHLAAGIELAPDQIRRNVAFKLRAAVAAPEKAVVDAVLTLTRLPDGAPRWLGKARFQLEAGKGSGQSFEAIVDADGTYVVALDLTNAQGKTLRAERAFRLGRTAERYQVPLPTLAGEPFWSLKNEAPLPGWMQHCERQVEYPMTPWNAPAKTPLKVLFLARVGHTTGILRDLARRAGAEWDFINFHGVNPPAFGSTRTNDGPYRTREQSEAAKKMAAMQPNCVLAAGIQFDNVQTELIDRLLAAVKRGTGLIMVGPPGKAFDGPWPAILARPEFKRLDFDLAGPLATLFAAGIAPPPQGQIECYEYGQGRIVIMRKKFVFGPHSYSRNDLLPQIRGRTRLPDWEYHFAQYIRAMRHAAGQQPTVRLVGIELGEDSIVLECVAKQAQTVTAAVDVTTTGLVRGERFSRILQLQAGRQTVRLPTPMRPGAEYVVHAWLLEGTGEETASTHAGNSWLARPPHPTPVLDFSAGRSVVETQSGVTITELRLEGEAQRTPRSCTVTVQAPVGGKMQPVRVAAEIRNGGYDRVVWRAEAAWRHDQDPVEFSDIDYQPVAPESLLVAKAYLGDQLVYLASRPFRAARLPGNVADDDVAYLTTTGTQADWYATRVTRPWALDTAGLDPTYYDRADLGISLFGVGGSSTSFPWQRGPGNTLSPPIVDEKPLRAGLAKALRGAFENSGTTYFCMQDEFRLGGEYDWSSATIRAFREHLREVYGTIARLNAEWATQFPSFDLATPILLADARLAPDRPARWLDFRLFMDSRVNRRYEIANEEAVKISALLRVGESGMYPPAYDVAVNYYTVARACRFMMTYPGLRARWVRAFLPEDAIAGVWRGYGSQHPRHPWEALFGGYRIVSWWGYMAPQGTARQAMIAPDLTPARRFPEVAREQSEIRRGLGKLLTAAVPVEPRLLISYSQASVYTANLLERNYVGASQTATRLAAAAGLACSFIADEQAATGRIDAMSDKFFLFPGAAAMPLAAATAYARAIDRGCWALADAELAWRNGHGSRLDASPLEAAFAINRKNAIPLPRGEAQPLAWTAAAPAELRAIEARLAPALRGLAAADGIVWATFPGGAPAIVARRAPAGSVALMLNTRLEWAPRRQSPLPAIAKAFLGIAGLEPALRVAPGSAVSGVTTALRHGGARYYGFLTRRPGEVQVTLPAAGHVYDVRAGKYLGRIAKFKDAVEPSQVAKAYAQLPYAVTGLSVAAAGAYQPGGTVKVRGRVEAPGGATEFHVIRCEVIRPDGVRPRHYMANLAAVQGRFQVELPLALNAKPGKWQVEFTDVATGTRGTASFTLKP